MPAWDPELYLRFAREREIACHDLARRTADRAATPWFVVDLGCGPGNSTKILRNLYPRAQIFGVDNDPEMLAKANRDRINARFVKGDLATYQPETPPNLIFSNAAIQWVPDHSALFERLMGLLAKGGWLAVQIPDHLDSDAHRLMAETARDERWRDRLEGVRDGNLTTQTAEQLYDLVAPHASEAEAWRTDYLHVLPSADAIAEWYRGSGMRPYLEALADDAEREAFVAALTEKLRNAYRPATDGKVVFTFRRSFVLARR